MKLYCENYLPLILGSMLLISSCVSNKQMAYLQYEDDLDRRTDIVTDSLIRVYESGALRYALQVNDILDIRIASPTPEEYNPFRIADRNITAGGSSGNSLGSGGNVQNRGYRIDPRGNLTLPVIGELRAEGLTIEQLEDTIDVLAAVELEDPVTRINLLNFRFSVLGEVAGEGVQYSSDHSLTMLQAIAMAGGAGEFGDMSRVKVIRRMKDRNYVFYLNLLDESFLASEFYFVQPQDMIVVPPLPSKPYLRYLGQNLSIVASGVSLALTIISLLTLYKP
ncbi:MAG: polysaccharide export protein [Bacteroidetes bacterium]|nr:MAG: polysaccharide export protein [Bacteroidota bacterium]